MRSSKRAWPPTKGEIAVADLAQIQHDAIRDVVHMQEELGLKVATDGEYNRAGWQRDFLFEIRQRAADRRETDGAVSFRRRLARSLAAGAASDR